MPIGRGKSVDGRLVDHQPPDSAESALLAYDHLLLHRDRLAGLAPLSRHELDVAMLALHEAVQFFLAQRSGATIAELPADALDQLVAASRERSADPFTILVAALAIKLAAPRTRLTASDIIDGLNDYLDTITFDVRATKRATLGLLAQARKEVDARIMHVRAGPPKAYRFVQIPEQYREREDKTEKPDQFFRRVYAAEVKRGMTQADLRRADPAFYNVLHVWCVRNKRLMSRLIPTSRPRVRPT